jgi:predicted ATPase
LVETERLELEFKGKQQAIVAHRLVSVAERSDAPPRIQAPLIGRRDALAQLEWALERAIAERSCRLASVIGVPGIGKSRLVHEFVTGLAQEATVLQGRCLPYGEGITFWPLAEMVKQAGGVSEGDGPDEILAKLEALLAPSEDVRTVASAVAQLTGLLETTGVVEEGFWAVRRLLGRLADARPLVVVLDDAQWAEATLLALIENVVRHMENLPILLLCAARPELLERRPDWGEIAGPGRSTTVRLEPLDDAACDRLIAELLGGPQQALEVRDHVAARAEGNPLFVEQMISMLIDEGRLEQVDGRWVAAGDLETADIPPGIHALLAARLERLGSDERAVIGRAAVIGQVFYVAALEELAPPALATRVPHVLLELVRKELVRPGRSDLSGQEAFEFRHLLIRDAAYDALSKESRADLHARFADWLEAASADQLAEYAEIIGWHLEQAYRYFSELGPLGERGEELARRAADRLEWSGETGKRVNTSCARGSTSSPPWATRTTSRSRRAGSRTACTSSDASRRRTSMRRSASGPPPGAGLPRRSCGAASARCCSRAGRRSARPKRLPEKQSTSRSGRTGSTPRRTL